MQFSCIRVYSCASVVKSFPIRLSKISATSHIWEAIKSLRSRFCRASDPENFRGWSFLLSPTAPNFTTHSPYVKSPSFFGVGARRNSDPECFRGCRALPEIVYCEYPSHRSQFPPFNLEEIVPQSPTVARNELPWKNPPHNHPPSSTRKSHFYAVFNGESVPWVARTALT